MSFSYRKIYADLVTPDGEVLVLYLTWLHAWGWRQAAAGAEVYRPDGTRRVWPARACPPGPARPLIHGWVVELALAAGMLRLEFGGALAPWVPPAPPPHPALDWRVLTPRCDVQASWPAHGATWRGLGYVDQVDLRAPPRVLGLSRLTWGRVHEGEGAVVFTHVVDRTGRVWDRVGPEAVESPLARLGGGRVLNEGPALDRDRMPGWWQRTVARALAGPVREARRVARCGGEYRALYEEVRFG